MMIAATFLPANVPNITAPPAVKLIHHSFQPIRLCAGAESSNQERRYGAMVGDPTGAADSCEKSKQESVIQLRLASLFEQTV
jgi:hypothetical protein